MRSFSLSQVHSHIELDLVDKKHLLNFMETGEKARNLLATHSAYKEPILKKIHQLLATNDPTNKVFEKSSRKISILLTFTKKNDLLLF